MLKIKGIYDGAKVVLLEPVLLGPNTPVEVLVPDQEKIYWQRLIELGLVKEICTPPTDDRIFAPVHVSGAPVSQTILEERRQATARC